MKVLSIQQPWAHLIVSGCKDVENRGWKTDYRGPLFIHASGLPWKWVNIKDCPVKIQEEIESSIENNIPQDRLPRYASRFDFLQRFIMSFHGIDETCTDEEFKNAMNQKPALQTQAIIGKVDLVDVVRGHDSPWSIPYNWHFVLENAVMFENPILNVKGKLNLWNFDLPEGYL